MPLMLLSFLFGCSETTPITDIEHFDFMYTQGNMAYAEIRYSLKQEDGKYIASIKPHGKPPEGAMTWVVDGNFVKDIENCLRTHSVGKWNGFDENDSTVLDGNHFNLSVRFCNDTRISATGYMKWPDHYKAFKADIQQLFDQSLNRSKSSGQQRH